MKESQPIENLIANRKEKLEKLRIAGIEPYPSNFSYTHTTFDIHKEFDSLSPGVVADKKIRVCGRIITRRIMGKATFSDIFNSTGKVQIYVKKDTVGGDSFEIFLNLIDIGDFIGVEGEPFKTRTGELTINVSRWQLLSKSLRPLPEKWHGLKDVETRYRQRYLDLISNENVRKTFQIRAKIITAVREYLDREEFLEVETPMIQYLAGGALARPLKTFHNTYNIELFLRIAPELALKMLTVGGLEKIYELGRSFRNEGIDRQHNPEFTMVEIYKAYSDYNDMMALCEGMLLHIIKANGSGEEITYGDKKISFKIPFKKASLQELFQQVLNKDIMKIIAEGNLKNLADELKIKRTGEESDRNIFDHIFDEYIKNKLIDPTFILDYPLEFSPLAKGKSGCPIAERFELFIAGEEVANAYSELNDPQEQKERFARQRKDAEVHPLDEGFITALEYGMPPCGGLGIGIDRLTMILTNSSSIREVILFPLLRPEEK